MYLEVQILPGRIYDTSVAHMISTSSSHHLAQHTTVASMGFLFSADIFPCKAFANCSPDLEKRKDRPGPLPSAQVSAPMAPDESAGAWLNTAQAVC